MVEFLWIFLLVVVCAVIGVALWYAFRPAKDKAESFTERPRVVVSFTTIPSRLPFLEEVAEQMALQTYQPDAIYACIPMVSKRLNLPYDISTVKIPSNLTVVRTEDYGPATKLLGCLEHERNPATIIITIDDDVKYSRYLVESLVKTAMKNPSCRIGSRASDRYHTKHINKRVDTTGDNIMLLGFGGIAYRRGMLTNSVRKWLQELPDTDTCWKSDDITLDRLISGGKIKISDLVVSEKTDAEHVDALKDDKRKQTYNSCYDTMDSISTMATPAVPH